MKKISKVIKEIMYLNNKINPSILASSLTFYLIISIIPLFILINNVLIELDIISTNQKTIFSSNIMPVLLLIISLIWSSSKLINNLLVISDIIYFDIQNRSKLNLRIGSIILTILFLLLVVSFITLFIYVSYLKVRLAKFIVIINLIQFILLYVFIIILIAFIYKYVIPVKVKFVKMLKISSVITIILFITTTIYQKILKTFLINKLTYLYLDYTSIIITCFWIYFNCYIFLIGISIDFLENRYKKDVNSI